jgi:hypothetical protein
VQLSLSHHYDERNTHSNAGRNAYQQGGRASTDDAHNKQQTTTTTHKHAHQPDRIVFAELPNKTALYSRTHTLDS